MYSTILYFSEHSKWQEEHHGYNIGKDIIWYSIGDLILKVLSEETGIDSGNLLGNFIDNHDNERFLYNHSGDVAPLKNGLTWIMLYQGIPIIYYGTEQVEVSNQKDNRFSMWPHYNITDI